MDNVKVDRMYCICEKMGIKDHKIMKRDINELIDDLTVARDEMMSNFDETHELIGEVLNVIGSLTNALTGFSQYTANVTNEDDGENYELFLLANSEEMADRIINDVFDDYFYDDKLKEQSMYSHSVTKL